MNRIERPKSLTELVSDALRREIVEGELQLGEALSEVKIAKRLDVSRTPVREAFARLDLEGLVRTEPQRGTFVFTLTADELRDICDVRVCLETAALKTAVRRNADALAADLREICEAMTKAREAGDDSAYLQLDTEFHQKLFEHAGNKFLTDAYQTIAAKMAALRNRLGAHPDHMTKSYREHLEMTDLIAGRDITRALKVLGTHIGRKEGSYWDI